LYQEFYITFKYLKEVILNNKVQIKNYELYKNLKLKIIKWRKKNGEESICLVACPKVDER